MCKVLAANPDDLSSASKTHPVEGEEELTARHACPPPVNKQRRCLNILIWENDVCIVHAGWTDPPYVTLVPGVYNAIHIYRKAQIKDRTAWEMGWRDGSAVKSTDCSSRALEFNFQQLHGGSQPLIMGSNAFFWCVRRQLQYTHIKKKQQQSLEIYLKNT